MFNALRMVYTPSEKFFKHLYFRGEFKVKIGNDKFFKLYHHGFQLENQIFWTGIKGEYEGVSLGLWIKACQNSRSIFDIGANTGIYALTAKGCNSKAEVYAFEPSERVFDKLLKNVDLNDFDVTCEKKALSNKKGVVEVTDVPTENQYILSLERDRLKNHEGAYKVKMETIDFDSYVQDNNIEIVDLIKIDVEYHEYEVLRGMKNCLKEMKPNLLVEIVDSEIGEKVNSLLDGLDYHYFNINDKTGEIIEVNRIERSFTYNYFICTREMGERVGLINK